MKSKRLSEYGYQKPSAKEEVSVSKPKAKKSKQELSENAPAAQLKQAKHTSSEEQPDDSKTIKKRIKEILKEMPQPERKKMRVDPTKRALGDDLGEIQSTEKQPVLRNQKPFNRGSSNFEQRGNGNQNRQQFNQRSFNRQEGQRFNSSNGNAQQQNRQINNGRRPDSNFGGRQSFAKKSFVNANKAIVKCMDKAEADLVFAVQDKRYDNFEACQLYVANGGLNAEGWKKLHPDIVDSCVNKTLTKAWLHFPDENSCKEAFSAISSCISDGEKMEVDYCGEKSSDAANVKESQKMKRLPMDPLTLRIYGMPTCVSIQEILNLFPDAYSVNIKRQVRGARIAIILQFEKKIRAREVFDKGNDMTVNGIKIFVFYAPVPGALKIFNSQLKKEQIKANRALQNKANGSPEKFSKKEEDINMEEDSEKADACKSKKEKVESSDEESEGEEAQKTNDDGNNSEDSVTDDSAIEDSSEESEDEDEEE